MGLLGIHQAPEIYTASIGLYIVWLTIRFGRTLIHHVSRGVKDFVRQFGLWVVQVR